MKNYKSINKKLNESRSYYKTLLNEQPALEWHEWRGFTNYGSTMQGGPNCSPGGSATIFAANLPGYVPGQNNSANNSSAASAANSLLFYQFLGSPSVGEFVQATITGGGAGMGTTAGAPVCWKYMGTRSTPKVFGSGNVLTYGGSGSGSAGVPGAVTNPLGPFNDCTTCYAATGTPTSDTPCYDCVNGVATQVELIGPNSVWCQNVPNGPQCGTDCTLIPMNALGQPGNFPLTNDPNMPCTTGCPPHDPSIGYPGSFTVSTWTNTWTNNGAFQNPNNSPNQPCQHISQRLDQWESQCTSGVGPLQQNMLAAKIEEGDNQYNIHNCSSSNASAC